MECLHQLRKYLLTTADAGLLEECSTCSVLILENKVTNRRVFSFMTGGDRGVAAIKYKRVNPQGHALMMPLTGQEWA